MSENLALNLTHTAAEHPDEIACKLDDAAFNYQLLDNASARIAAMLADKGIEAGDRVAIMLPNVPYFPAVYYGILRLGAVVVPMNVLLKAREVAYYLEDSGAELIFAWHGFLEAAEAGANGPRRRRRGRVGRAGRVRGADLRARPQRRRRRGRGRRHRGDPLHLGHDRQAEGRRAHARQPAQERRRPRSGSSGSASAT